MLETTKIADKINRLLAKLWQTVRHKYFDGFITS